MLRERGRIPEVLEQDPVRFELMYQFGAFPTESSGHVSEYLPYFRTHPDLVKRWHGQGVHRRVRLLRPQLADLAPRERRDAARGCSTATRSSRWSAAASTPRRSSRRWPPGPDHRLRDHHQRGLGRQPAPGQRGRGGGAWSTPTASTRSRSAACRAHLASLVRRHQEFNDLAVTSILDQDREAAVHALMLDPLTAAACELRQIREMFDEMVDAQREHLPELPALTAPTRGPEWLSSTSSSSGTSTPTSSSPRPISSRGSGRPSSSSTPRRWWWAGRAPSPRSVRPGSACGSVSAPWWATTTSAA